MLNEAAQNIEPIQLSVDYQTITLVIYLKKCSFTYTNCSELIQYKEKERNGFVTKEIGI